MRGISDLLSLYHLGVLFRFLWSKRNLWADKSTRDLRYLIAASVPLGVIVHFDLYARQTGGWVEFIDKNFSRSYEVGDLGWTIFSFVVASLWFGYAYLILAVHQLKFRTREALTVVLVTAVAIIGVDVVAYVNRGNSEWGLLLVPLLFFLPMVVVGLIAAHLVERISEPKGRDEDGKEPD